jgi:hypothetical protein
MRTRDTVLLGSDWWITQLADSRRTTGCTHTAALAT